MKPNLHKYVTIGKTYMLTDDGMAVASMRDSTIQSHLETNEYWLNHKERLQGKTIYEWRDERQKIKEVDTGYKGKKASYWYNLYVGNNTKSSKRWWKNNGHRIRKGSIVRCAPTGYTASSGYVVKNKTNTGYVKFSNSTHMCKKILDVLEF